MLLQCLSVPDKFHLKWLLVLLSESRFLEFRTEQSITKQVLRNTEHRKEQYHVMKRAGLKLLFPRCEGSIHPTLGQSNTSFVLFTELSYSTR